MDATTVKIAIHTGRKLRVLETASALYGRTVFVTAVDAETNMVRVKPVNERGFATLEAGVVMLWDLEAFPEDEILVPHTYSPTFRTHDIRCECGSTTTVSGGEIGKHGRPYGSEYREDAVHRGTWLCRHSGRAATLRVALEREARLTREESRIRYIIGGALKAEGAELPPFPWERRQRENPAV